jgi:hypothetical protein
MELTEQQYEQVIRYVEGVMEVSEKEAFEVDMLQDSVLVEEVERYREVRSLGLAIEQKLGSSHQFAREAKDEEVWQYLQQAREDWERDKETTGITEMGQGKIRGLYMRRWLLAAVLIGVLCLGGVLWWYMQQGGTEEPKVAVKQKGPSAIQTDTSSSRITVPPVQDTTPATNLVQKIKSNKAIQSEKHFQFDDTKREALYAHNFQPDTIPEDQPDALKDAFVSYNEGNYGKTIEAIEKVKLAPVTRGEDSEEELTEFYMHYYKAQSFMATDSIMKAINELKKAKTSDSFLQSKKQWYLALAYLKTGDLLRARQFLKQLQINKQAESYKKKAQILLKELRSK